ncbi:MAG: RIP metalloprotease RseP [Magnetococcales bacterium]|nr:RIP metalloprotease RseP [Magnetococcales bacterium]|tara:strand:+ start:35189 stop:36367 length:1179 start_codon:yes stop_codon:yes gene_type:complete
MDFSLESINGLVSSLPGGDVLWMALMFIVVLSILVFFHELGHYLAARSVGVRVTTFSIGFGKELFGWNDKHGTRWKFSLVPLGGYVQMFGDTETKDLTEAEKSEAFLEKGVWQRIWVVFAGPLANFVLAIVFLFGLMLSGEEVLKPHVGTVTEGSAAEAGGIQEGDLFLVMDGNPVFKWDDVVKNIAASQGKPMTLVMERDAQALTLLVAPKVEKRNNLMGEEVVIPFLGVSPSGERTVVEHSVGDALVLGFTRTYDITARILEGIGKIITGSVSAKHVGGPVMIAEVAGQAGSQGWYSLVMFMVVISINLGLINLFPIPVLDGGHLLFYFIEALRGKPLGEKAQEYGYRVGFGLIMMLMLLAISNDILRVVNKFTDDKEQVTLEAPVQEKE